jgi:hypothetical protein
MKAAQSFTKLAEASQADLPPSSPPEDEPTSKSEALKEIGNEHFRQGRHLDAID